MQKIVRTEEEIQEVIHDAYLWKSTGRWRGMTFEEGLDTMYEWLTGESDDRPVPEWEDRESYL